MPRLHRALWVIGWPLRAVLIAGIKMYRLLLRPLLGGQCRFHPTCSVYAEDAIREAGAVRGVGLAVWRVLRCSPLTTGGVDLPPAGSSRLFLYDVIHRDGRATADGEYDIIIREESRR